MSTTRKLKKSIRALAVCAFAVARAQTQGTITAVVNSASFTGAPAPGSVASIFGANLAGGTAQASAVPLPTSLGGVTVTVNGFSAPLWYVSPGLINFEMPAQVKPGQATVAVSSGGSSSVTVPQAAPGIFTYGADRAVAVNAASYTLADSGHPAAPNSIIAVYLTGIGPLDNPVSTNTPAPSQPLSRAVLPASATIGGQNAPIQFIGLTPGEIALAQANLTVPNLPPGDYPVTITVGGMTSNAPLISVSSLQFTSAPGSWLGIDTLKRLAYVASLRTDPTTGHSRVVVLDLSADPDVTNPRKAIVQLPTSDYPGGTAVDSGDGLVFVAAGSRPNVDGNLYIISENSSTVIQTIPFPPGSQPAHIPGGGPSAGLVWFDQARHKVIVATCDSATCSSGTARTGVAVFDVASKTFGPIIPANLSIPDFSLDSPQDLLVDPSRDDSTGQIYLVDLSHQSACRLSDSNLTGFDVGSTVDPTTHLAVVSNGGGQIAVLNLNGISFTGEGTASCTAQESGTQPNSVLVGGPPSQFLPGQLEGGATNPNTHQVFLPPLGINQMALVSLPSQPVAQLSPNTAIPWVYGSVPNDPTDLVWGVNSDNFEGLNPSVRSSHLHPQIGTHPSLCNYNCETEPNSWATGIDPVHNFGYAQNESGTFLVQVDLAQMQKDPAGIGTPLPAGNCAGTTTFFACSNGHGITFFPLPQ